MALRTARFCESARSTRKWRSLSLASVGFAAAWLTLQWPRHLAQGKYRGVGGRAEGSDHTGAPNPGSSAANGGLASGHDGKVTNPYPFNAIHMLPATNVCMVIDLRPTLARVTRVAKNERWGSLAAGAQSAAAEWSRKPSVDGPRLASLNSANGPLGASAVGSDGRASGGPSGASGGTRTGAIGSGSVQPLFRRRLSPTTISVDYPGCFRWFRVYLVARAALVNAGTRRCITPV